MIHTAGEWVTCLSRKNTPLCLCSAGEAEAPLLGQHLVVACGGG